MPNPTYSGAQCCFRKSAMHRFLGSPALFCGDDAAWIRPGTWLIVSKGRLGSRRKPALGGLLGLIANARYAFPCNRRRSFRIGQSVGPAKTSFWWLFPNSAAHIHWAPRNKQFLPVERSNSPFRCRAQLFTTTAFFLKPFGQSPHPEVRPSKVITEALACYLAENRE